MIRSPGPACARGVLNLSANQGKSIIGMVNLLLKMLDRVRELPPPNSFPENLEKVLDEIEKALGTGVASRLRMFVGKYVNTGIGPRASTKQWIPFRRHAFAKYDHWEKPKPHPITMFHLYSGEKGKGMWFPVNQYYKNIALIDTESIQQELRKLGFQPTGKLRDYSIDLRLHSDQIFFDKLLDFILRTAEDFEATLSIEKV